jgi:hypothetical protein
MSWNRFTLILDLLGFDHILAAIKKDGEIVGDKSNKDKIREYYMKEAGKVPSLDVQSEEDENEDDEEDITI